MVDAARKDGAPGIVRVRGKTTRRVQLCAPNGPCEGRPAMGDIVLNLGVAEFGREVIVTGRVTHWFVGENNNPGYKYPRPDPGDGDIINANKAPPLGLDVLDACFVPP